MIITNFKSNTDEWLAHRRLHLNASEAPMMMSASPNVTRNELLTMKATGLDREFGDWFQKNILDNGHVVEAMARPIAERIVGEDLYPVSATDDDGRLAASYDGMTMLETINWECKQWNKDKAADVEAGRVPECDYWQVTHQLAINPDSKTLYMITDGTEERTVHIWVEANQDDIKKLNAGWAQFEKDLAEHIPAAPEAPKAEGKAPESLPALVVRASGMVEASNLKEFEAIARATLAGINTDLQTDNDFADAEKAVKFCTDVEKRLDGARENVLGQMQTVDEVVRSIDAIKEETRQIRLKLSKAVKDQKESRKLEILTAARAAHGKFYNALERALEDEAGGIPITLDESKGPDFAGAMKGKRTISSLNDACDDLLARTKIELNETAEIIRGNIRQLNENAGDYKFLFSDFGHLSQYSAESFAGVMNGRIAGHKQAEHDRLEAERAKIRAEEEVKARREAEMASKKAEDERQQEADQQALKQKQAEQNKRLAAEAETAKAEMASREQYDEGQKAAKQPAPVAAKAAQPTPVNKGAHPERPSTTEIISVLASHYGVDTGVVALWIHELKVQEAA